MVPRTTLPRRGFVAGLAAGSLGVMIGPGGVAAEPAIQASQHDAWLDKLTGAHKQFFDAPRHEDGLGQILVFNYLNTYTTAYGLKPGEAQAVLSCYGPPRSPGTIPVAWNDAMWAKYRVGELIKLNGPDGMPATRNMFYRPMAGDPILFGGAMAKANLEALMSMGTTVLMCNNSLMGWVGWMASTGRGDAAEIEKDIRANLVPGVVTVPAMVIAIEKGQARGLAYKRV
jgi:hypothetical protein